ncbi:MAG: ribosome recycling factor [Deferribacteraceae bacterium]|jgi:ribosome recycling factor|nr:ribosome recycling factor [Deferribacteraceae bacterium]
MLKDVAEDVKAKMEKTIQYYKTELKTVRTGRASTSLLDNVRVDAYGVQTPLSGVGTLHAPDPHMLTIQPWDPSLTAAIEKAILSSGLGLNPSSDGKLIRVPIPTLTEQRRKELVKLVWKKCEEAKIVIRNERRDANEAIKKLEKDKENTVSEDEAKLFQTEVQKITDSFIKNLDEIAKAKEKELLEI